LTAVEELCSLAEPVVEQSGHGKAGHPRNSLLRLLSGVGERSAGGAERPRVERLFE
jgi:hypothetical protein